MCRLAGFGCNDCFRGDSSRQRSRVELQAARSSATLRCDACDMTSLKVCVSMQVVGGWFYPWQLKIGGAY